MDIQSHRINYEAAAKVLVAQRYVVPFDKLSPIAQDSYREMARTIVDAALMVPVSPLKDAADALTEEAQRLGTEY